MTAAAAWEEGVVYLRTQTKEKYETYTEHRCWNAALFVARAMSVSLDEGGIVQRVSRADFLSATRRR